MKNLILSLQEYEDMKKTISLYKDKIDFLEKQLVDDYEQHGYVLKEWVAPYKMRIKLPGTLHDFDILSGNAPLITTISQESAFYKMNNEISRLSKYSETLEDKNIKLKNIISNLYKRNIIKRIFNIKVETNDEIEIEKDWLI